ncbi:MAG: response regulator [Limisphaerales bacterium]
MINATQNSSLSPPTNKILLCVEENPDDRFFIEHVVRKLGKHLEVRFAVDGQEAVEWLRGDGIYADRAAHPLPNLLLTDLKMPRMDGLELLGWVRSQPQFETLPVVVYSGSVLDGIAELTKKLGATHYIGKSIGCTALTEFLRTYCGLPQG